jgi:hypothetical protein
VQNNPSIVVEPALYKLQPAVTSEKECVASAAASLAIENHCFGQNYYLLSLLS